MASSLKLSAAADGGDIGRSDDRSNAGYLSKPRVGLVLDGQGFDLLFDLFLLGVDPLQFDVEHVEHGASRGGQPILAIFQRAHEFGT